MGINLEYDSGQTPIDPEEKRGLLIKSITNRKELDEHEQLNIENAIEWTLKKKFKKEELLGIPFVLELHKKMFGQVWNWAGKFRNSNKNIGVDKFQIQPKLKLLIDDCKYWVENKIFPEDEIAIRFKHRLVSIHPFVNGNGRHSRLTGDVIVNKVFQIPVFTWGSKLVVSGDDLINIYLNSLRNADNGDYTKLLLFARS